MFCEKCGKENPENVKFCEGCGAPFAVPAEETVTSEPPVAESPIDKIPKKIKKFDFKKALKIAVPALAVVLAIVLAVCLFGGSKYENTVEDYLNARADGDSAKLKKLVGDPYYLEYLSSDDGGDYNDEEIGWLFDEEAEDAMDSIRESYGKNAKYSVKTVYLTKYSEKQIKKIANHLEDKYGYEKSDIKNLVVLEYTATVKGSEGSSIYDGERALIKINSKWYISKIIHNKDDIRDILD